MKKRDLKKLALLGLTSGMLVANQASLHANVLTTTAPITEAELLSQLSPEAQLLYMGLDEQGQALARLVTSERCGCQKRDKAARSGHGCGGGQCGGGTSDSSGGNYGRQRGYYDSTGHYYGAQNDSQCGGSTQCNGQGKAPGQPSHPGSSQCGGSTGCYGQNQPQGQPGQKPGQPSISSNTNKSMPRFDDQPKYQQNYRSTTPEQTDLHQNQWNQSPSQYETPKKPAKPTALRDTKSRSQSRYIAEVTEVQQVIGDDEFKAGLKDDANKKTFADWVQNDREKADKAKASASCKNLNDCSGLNGCKSTSDHSCKGQGTCKGTAEDKMTPDEAVKAVQKKMNNKRTALRGK